MLSGNLPNDVTVEILSRLPVKSLVRFKGVSKSWLALVGNPRFIAKQHQTLRSSCKSNGSCILFKRKIPITDIKSKDVISFLHREVGDDDSIGMRCVDIDLPFLRDAKVRYICFVGSVNGIICVVYWDNPAEVYLWNPANRGEFKALPLSPQPRPPPEFSDRGSGCGCIGFCFDPRSNDYKVVRIWNYYFLQNRQRYAHKVEVCGLTNDHSNSWREIDAVPPLIPSQASDDYVYTKGKCYWRSDLEYGKEKLVSFDLSDEVFQVIDLPDALIVGIIYFNFWHKILLLNESIALASFPLQVNDKCFEVWLMNDESSSGVSWTKYMTVETLFPEMMPLGFGANGELFLQHSRNEKLLCQDPDTSETKDLGVYVNNLQPVIIYQESLVSVKEENGLQELANESMYVRQ